MVLPGKIRVNPGITQPSRAVRKPIWPFGAATVLEVFLMQQPSAGDDARFRWVLVKEVGDVANQGFHRKPHAGFKTRVQCGMLRLEPSFASASRGHPKCPCSPVAARTAIIVGSEKRDNP